MDLQKRQLALLFALALLLVAGCEKPLPEWMQPGIREGADRIQKTLYMNLDDIGVVTDIEVGELRAPRKTEVGVAGYNGARFFDLTRALQASIQFTPRDPLSASIVRRTPVSEVLFYRHGSLHEDSLVDARGRNLWRIREGIASAAFGDIGIAGAPEFFSVEEKFSEGGKVVARDVAGKTVWERQGLARWNSSLALIRKQSAEGASLVMDSSVALKSGEEEDLLIGLRGDGQTVFQRKPAIDLQEFITLNWLPVCPESCLLMSWNDGFYLVRSDGSKVLSKLPGGYVSDVHATPVQFMEGGSPWLAIAGTLNYKGSNFAGLQAIHGALYLFDGEGHPVYHEVLGEECRAVAALPSEDHKSESLLVGGVDKVWQYILTK